MSSPNSARRILTIEDDEPIRRGIVDSLTYAGFDVIEAADGNTGREVAIRQDYDLLLLDLTLPGCDGMEILQQVRLVRPMLPVIVLTARGEERDRVSGLQVGADDYVVKPFSVNELLARVEAVLRRCPERPVDLAEKQLGDRTVDFARREVRFSDGSRQELSDREAELLRYLAVHAGRAVSRDELLANVWRISPRGAATRTIDMHVTRIREKLRDDPADPQFVLTVRGKGYMFGSSRPDSNALPGSSAEGTP